MLGVGFAAFRDVASFFKTATQDAEGTSKSPGYWFGWYCWR